MRRSRWHVVAWLSHSLLALFAFDRILKMISIIHFFGRKPPPDPQIWPSVTLFQPITRGVSGLSNSLRSRALLDYAGKIQHMFICDAHDMDTQNACKALLRAFPLLQAELVLVEAVGNTIATKTEKLLAALPHANSEIFCFIDDDIALRPKALREMLPYLSQPDVGAVFGLACYTNWRTVWSSLMSIFVNANALLSYIPITYLTEPFTITGHIFALQRVTFEEIGGMIRLENRIDDDHEMARRVRKAGLRNVQTPMIYDVDNHFTSLSGYMKQIQRWFIFPRQAMLPFMTTKEKAVSLLASIGQIVPALLALLTIFTLRRSAFRALIATIGLFGMVYMLCELCYLRRYTPIRRWPLVPLFALLGPLQIVWALLSKEEIEWRGRRLRIHVGGEMEVIS